MISHKRPAPRGIPRTSWPSVHALSPLLRTALRRRPCCCDCSSNNDIDQNIDRPPLLSFVFNFGADRNPFSRAALLDYYPDHTLVVTLSVPNGRLRQLTMASLRRPSSFFPSHKNDTPKSKLSTAGDSSRRREPSKSKVEQKMQNRRLSRYARLGLVLLTAGMPRISSSMSLRTGMQTF